jgi:hypothetical protein
MSLTLSQNLSDRWAKARGMRRYLAVLTVDAVSHCEPMARIARYAALASPTCQRSFAGNPAAQAGTAWPGQGKPARSTPTVARWLRITMQDGVLRKEQVLLHAAADH